jgi:hypothetical protein
LSYPKLWGAWCVPIGWLFFHFHKTPSTFHRQQRYLICLTLLKQIGGNFQTTFRLTRYGNITIWHSPSGYDCAKQYGLNLHVFHTIMKLLFRT